MKAEFGRKLEEYIMGEHRRMSEDESYPKFDGQKLEEHLMHEHWRMVEDKPYPKLKGVWEARESLPVIYDCEFNPIDGEPLEIPLVGGGHIKFGSADSKDCEIGLDIKFPTARGDDHMMEDNGIIVTRWEVEGDPYPFWIFYDDHSHDERMKYLSRMDPDRDVDWEKIKPFSIESKIALAMCKYKKLETRFKRK
jgi:hypothetical protein